MLTWEANSSLLLGPKSVTDLPLRDTATAIQGQKVVDDSAQRSLDDAGHNDVIIAGSIAMDLICDLDTENTGRSGDQLQPHTSNPVAIREHTGGVGRNIATATSYLGLKSQLCTVVGNDSLGSLIVERLRGQGLSTSGVQRLRGDSTTARYIALNNADKQLHLAAADMRVFSAVDVDVIASQFKEWIVGSSPWVVVDANWTSDTIRHWLEAAKAAASKTAFEPVSAAKATRLFGPAATQSSKADLPILPHNIVDLATPNSLELRSMWNAARDSGQFDREDWFKIINAFGLTEAGSRERLQRLTSPNLVDQGIPQQSLQLLPFVPCLTVTLGGQGVLLTQLMRSDDARLRSPAAAPYILPSPMSSVSGGVYMRLFPPREKIATEDLISVNGVGDTFLGAMIAGLVRSGSGYVEDSIDFAQECAILTLKSEEAVSPMLSSMKARLFEI